MKKLLILVLLANFLFIIINLVTAKWKYKLDGNDEVGFPVIFYTKFSGECDPCLINPYEIDFSYLLLDILFFYAFTFLLFIVIVYSKKILFK